jgi:lipoprotein-releasing system permease protein
LKSHETDADESAITEQLQTIFNNKITIKTGRNSMNRSIKMLNTENIAVYLIFYLNCCGTFQLDWR